MHRHPIRHRMSAMALLPSIAGAVLLLGSACAREATDPNKTVAPSFDWLNNPDNGNIRISRTEDGFAISWTDASNGLRVTQTTFPLATSCGPQSALDPIDEQFVGLPTDPKVRANIRGPVAIFIRDITQPGTCRGNRLVAQGTGQLHYTDNDFAGPGPEGANADAFGYMGVGDLTTPDGIRQHYNGSLRLTARFLGGDPTDPANYAVVGHTSSVNLK